MALLKTGIELFRFNVTAPKPAPDAAVPPPVEQFTNIAILADAVAVMSRFISKLSTSSPFAQAQLGTAEWLALNIFQRTGSSSNKQLSKSLGITGQRAKQICDSLETDGLILIVPSSVDARRKVITLTDAGLAQVTALNEELLQLMKAAPQRDLESGLVRAYNFTRKRLLPIVEQADTAQRAEK